MKLKPLGRLYFSDRPSHWWNQQSSNVIWTDSLLFLASLSCIFLQRIWSKKEHWGFGLSHCVRIRLLEKSVDIPDRKAHLVHWKAQLFFSLVRGLQSSPFNLDRTLLAVFLMSAVRSSSSCLVSEEGARGGNKSGQTPDLLSPSPQLPHSSTHSRLGWGRPGWRYAVFSLAPRPLTASQCSPGSLPPGAANWLYPAKSSGQTRASTGRSPGSGKWARPRGTGNRPRGVGIESRGWRRSCWLGIGVSVTCSKNSSMK